MSPLIFGWFVVEVFYWLITGKDVWPFHLLRGVL